MRELQTAQKSKSSTHSIDNLVRRVFSQLGCATTINGWRVVNNWSEIVGETMAKQSRAFKYIDGTLYVAVDNATWRQEFVMRVSEILSEIYKLPYGRAVKQIRFVKGDKGRI